MMYTMSEISPARVVTVIANCSDLVTSTGNRNSKNSLALNHTKDQLLCLDSTYGSTTAN